jgi:hypothetical protein
MNDFAPAHGDMGRIELLHRLDPAGLEYQARVKAILEEELPGI